ncbi:MAG: pectate lyase, partial [Pedobacter sp.]
AWDGLSKYDLTKYNPWYWNRLKQYADLADQKSLVLVHQNYFQHNIIEAGAHYADFPWRTTNNINATGFPEPVNYAGDKRLFMAEQFYDVSNPTRKKLHTAYIRKCLDNFRDNNGVIQLISAEYTGPLHFVQFWLDVIKAWEKETGKKEIIGLSTTKDVQDAILADPARATVVDLIDIRYWHYQSDGSVYAPKGGQNLAPRQHARLLKPKATSFEQVYRAVKEYKEKFPSKAVMYSGDNSDTYGWAVFMAGGSLAAIPHADQQFLNDASAMKPLGSTGKQYVLGNEGKGYIVYNDGGKVEMNLKSGTYKVRWINPRDGKVIKEGDDVRGGQTISLATPQQGASIT